MYTSGHLLTQQIAHSTDRRENPFQPASIHSPLPFHLTISSADGQLCPADPMQNTCLYLPSYGYDIVSHPDSACIENKPSHLLLSFDDVALMLITFPLYCFIDTWASGLYTRQHTQAK